MDKAQVPGIDPRIVEFILDSQATDIFRTARTQHRLGRKSDFTEPIADDEALLAAYVFKPRSQVLELAGLPEQFRDQVRPFNVLGLVRERDGQGVDSGKMTLDLLGGAGKPLGGLKSALELRRALHPAAVVAFTGQLLRLRGLVGELAGLDYEDFMRAMREGQSAALGPRGGFPGMPGMPGPGGFGG